MQFECPQLFRVDGLRSHLLVFLARFKLDSRVMVLVQAIMDVYSTQTMRR